MTPQQLLETLELHAKSSVCHLEPKQAAEWAAVVRSLIPTSGIAAWLPATGAVADYQRTTCVHRWNGGPYCIECGWADTNRVLPSPDGPRE